jgi:hypothetical protein
MISFLTTVSRNPPDIEPTFPGSSLLMLKSLRKLTSRRPRSDRSPAIPSSRNNCKLTCGPKPMMGSHLILRYVGCYLWCASKPSNSFSSSMQNVRVSRTGNVLNALKAPSCEPLLDSFQEDIATLRICLE